MSLNVNRNVTDAFYRYKMPRLVAKVEGKGNGIKTVLVNITDVSKALARPPTYATKYFGCELGAQTTLNVKDERFIVNGSHDSNKLQEILDGFIRKFVLCPECDNPETNLIVKKATIGQRCIACGYNGQIDMRHKLTTFILKNPPTLDQQNDHGTETPNKKDGKKGGKKAKGKQNGHDAEKEPSSPEANVNAQEQSAAARTAGVNLDVPPAASYDDDEDDWGEDTSAEAMKARMQELTDAAKSLAMNDDLEKTPQERVDLFYNYVKNKKNSGELIKGAREIVAEAERLDVKDKAPLILGEILFTQNMISEMKDYRLLFLRFTHENPKAQKYLLGAFEILVGDVHKAVLMPKVPLILKAFYDHDILDEEVLIDWNKKVSKKYVSKAVCQEIHDKASPFIKWLQEAEEEESEESDEDVEVVYSHTEKIGVSLKEPAKTAAPAAPEEDEDDFDIDAI